MRINNNLTRLLPAPLALAAAAWCGCTVGPDYVSPALTVPEAWVSPVSAPATDPGAADLVQWWVAFDDPVLGALIDDAFTRNTDLKLAASRLRQSRASRRVAAAAAGPSVATSGAIQRNDDGQTAATRYQTGFDATWEIDLFGGLRREIEAADADVRAAAESWRDVRVTLAAEVARVYVELCTSQRQLALARQTCDAWEKSATLTRKRFESGFVSVLDVTAADAKAASAAAQLPTLETAIGQAGYALCTLLDYAPGALSERLAAAMAVPRAAHPVPIGLPSELLQRRPDIRKAEASIRAATARIGAATSDLYPKFVIGGSLGWQAPTSGDLFDSLSRFWSLGPSVTWNILNSGRLQAAVDVQEALHDQSVLTYRQTVLTAIREVEDALLAASKARERRASLEAAAAASRRATALALSLYGEGQTDLLNVLSAQSALYAAEDGLILSAQSEALQQIALYKALGGGWAPAIE